MKIRWLALVVLALFACVHPPRPPAPVVHEHVHVHKGPPPWAPAHGYRHKHRGVDMEFDRSIGVYIVVGHPDYWFHRDHFYRFHDGHWLWAPDFHGHWVHVDAVKVPSGLRGKHDHGHGKSKHKGHGPPAKIKKK